MGEKVTREGTFFITEIITAIVWLVIMFTNGDWQYGGFCFWAAFAFGLIAFILGAVMILYFTHTIDRDTTEAAYLPFVFTAIFTGAYILVALLYNTIFAFKDDDDAMGRFFAINIIWIAIYIVAVLYARKYILRIKETSSKISNRIRPITTISTKLACLVAITTDPAAKQQILKLKESVDYGSNMSQNFSEATEQRFLMQLNELEALIQTNAPADQINTKIQQAQMTWNSRNAMVGSIR